MSGESLDVLIGKLEGATGPLDIETLGRVICAMHGVEFGRARISCGDDGSDELNVYDSVGGFVWGGYRWRAPDVSLDAIVGLIERELPGSGWNVLYRAMMDWRTHVEQDVTRRLPLVLCVAFLRAHGSSL